MKNRKQTDAPLAPARTRLLAEAMRLFAERGYEETTVADIERAAGLAPRSGALYQHFTSKEELLHAAVNDELRQLEELGSVFEMLPLGDLRAELTLLARWNLSSLSRRGALLRFLSHDGDRLPKGLKDKLYEGLVVGPYEQVFEMVRSRLAHGGSQLDVEALAVVLIESMSGYRMMQLTFGKAVGEVDDERFVQSWVTVVLALAHDAGLQ